MKKLIAPTALILTLIAVTAAILAPGATSETNELDHIAILEEQVAELQEATANVQARYDARVENLERDVAFLSRQADCIRAGVPVTLFRDGPGAKPYLAPTRKTDQKRMWVVVMSQGCMPAKLKPNMLGWSW